MVSTHTIAGAVPPLTDPRPSLPSGSPQAKTGRLIPTPAQAIFISKTVHTIAEMEKSVFDKLDTASKRGTGVSLTHAELELLLDCLGDTFGKAESEYELWCERFEDFKQSSQRESQRSNSES